MKKLLYLVYLSFIVLASGLMPSFAEDAPNSPEQLRSELEAAIQAKDTNTIISLFNSEGETNEWRESADMRSTMISLQAHAMLYTNIVSIQLLPMPADFPLPQTNEHNGIRTKFNVTIVGMIEVKSENASVQRLPYGKIGNGFYLAGIIQEKMTGQLLNVRVLAGPNPDLLTFTGSWVYVTHNHPSGDPSASDADIKVTRDLIRAGQLLKIEITDHIIIGSGNEYRSLKALGYFSF